MKRLATAAIFALSVAVSGMASAESALHDILSNGVLKVGTTGD